MESGFFSLLNFAAGIFNNFLTNEIYSGFETYPEVYEKEKIWISWQFCDKALHETFIVIFLEPSAGKYNLEQNSICILLNSLMPSFGIQQSVQRGTWFLMAQAEIGNGKEKKDFIPLQLFGSSSLWRVWNISFSLMHANKAYRG